MGKAMKVLHQLEPIMDDLLKRCQKMPLLEFEKQLFAAQTIRSNASRDMQAAECCAGEVEFRCLVGFDRLLDDLRAFCTIGGW